MKITAIESALYWYHFIELGIILRGYSPVQPLGLRQFSSSNESEIGSVSPICKEVFLISARMNTQKWNLALKSGWLPPWNKVFHFGREPFQEDLITYDLTYLLESSLTLQSF